MVKQPWTSRFYVKLCCRYSCLRWKLVVPVRVCLHGVVTRIVSVMSDQWDGTQPWPTHRRAADAQLKTMARIKAMWTQISRKPWITNTQLYLMGTMKVPCKLGLSKLPGLLVGMAEGWNGRSELNTAEDIPPPIFGNHLPKKKEEKRSSANYWKAKH